jgi:hypothetical protein
MQKRNSKTVAAHLKDAVQEYEAVVGELEESSTSREAMVSVQGRGKLMSGIEKIANLETEAVAELENATRAFE